LQNETLSKSLYNSTKKKQSSTKKPRNLSVHIVVVELSTAVVKVDIINATLTQNQCLQWVTPPLMHVEMPRPPDATELNNDGVIKLGNMSTTIKPF